MRLSVVPKGERHIRPGDIYHKYYFPTVLAGRTAANASDIKQLIDRWVAEMLELPSPHREWVDGTAYERMLTLFKSMQFSLIHSITELEDSVVCWQLLCGVWADVFIDGYNSAFQQKKQSDNDMHFIQCIGYIMCLYLIFYTQYQQAENAAPQRIPMSPDTLQKCVDVCEACESQFGFRLLRQMLKLLMNDGGIMLSIHNGPQYYYRNRVGNPLQIYKDPLRFKKAVVFRTDLNFLKKEMDVLRKENEDMMQTLLSHPSSSDELCKAVRNYKSGFDKNSNLINAVIRESDGKIVRPSNTRLLEMMEEVADAKTVPEDTASTTIKDEEAAYLQSLEDELISGMEIEEE